MRAQASEASVVAPIPPVPEEAPTQAAASTVLCIITNSIVLRTWYIECYQDLLALEVDYDDEPIIISVIQAEPRPDSLAIKSEALDDEVET